MGVCATVMRAFGCHGESFRVGLQRIRSFGAWEKLRALVASTPPLIVNEEKRENSVSFRNSPFLCACNELSSSNIRKITQSVASQRGAMCLNISCCIVCLFWKDLIISATRRIGRSWRDLLLILIIWNSYQRNTIVGIN